VKVILDSSFLFIPVQFRVDIYVELAKLLNRKFEPMILSPTTDELERIAKGGSAKLRKQAALALQFAKKCRQVEAMRGKDEPHDDVIVRVASEARSYVATNDRALRKRLRALEVPVIYLRQKSRLALEGTIQEA
jgi:hypothetical protein